MKLDSCVPCHSMGINMGDIGPCSLNTNYIENKTYICN